MLTLFALSHLVTPEWHVGLSERMEDYQPWGSDYYVIRPDLFVSQPVTDNENPAEIESNSPSSASGRRQVVGLMLLALYALVPSAV